MQFPRRSPSCPRSFLPQPYISPLRVKAKTCTEPTANRLTNFPFRLVTSFGKRTWSSLPWPSLKLSPTMQSHHVILYKLFTVLCSLQDKKILTFSPRVDVSCRWECQAELSSTVNLRYRYIGKGIHNSRNLAAFASTSTFCKWEWKVKI